jgi:hypothetical protein
LGSGRGGRRTKSQFDSKRELALGFGVWATLGTERRCDGEGRRLTGPQARATAGPVHLLGAVALMGADTEGAADGFKSGARGACKRGLASDFWPPQLGCAARLRMPPHHTTSQPPVGPGRAIQRSSRKRRGEATEVREGLRAARPPVASPSPFPSRQPTPTVCKLVCGGQKEKGRQKKQSNYPHPGKSNYSH